MATEKQKMDQIRNLISKAENLLEEARSLSVNLEPDKYGGKPSFTFNGPAYGMGGWVGNGEWQASSESC